jgi:hypothetical protein
MIMRRKEFEFYSFAWEIHTPSLPLLFLIIIMCSCHQIARLIKQYRPTLQVVRDAAWQRIYMYFEDELIPTIDALKRHYKSALWDINYWNEQTT